MFFYLFMSVYETLSETQQFACRVIADHARSAAFAIADGILPGNEGRNYVLRKIMRRAIYHGREHLGLTDPFFYKVCDFVVDQMHEAFPELELQRDFISKMVRMEEERFGNTVTVGLARLNELGITAASREDPDLFPRIARLYDTFGTPRDLIRVYLEEKGVRFDEDEFNERFESALQAIQNESGIGKTERKSQIDPIYAELLEKVGPNAFHGYERIQIDGAKVVALLDGNKEVRELSEGQQGIIVLTETPFDAEAGGQAPCICGKQTLERKARRARIGIGQTKNAPSGDLSVFPADGRRRGRLSHRPRTIRGYRTRSPAEAGRRP